MKYLTTDVYLHTEHAALVETMPLMSQQELGTSQVETSH